MKKLLNLFTLLFLGFALFMFSCTGPEGPAGPAGPAGTNGTDGTNGKDGADGVAKCGACHDLSTNLYAKIIQYQNSVHFTGGNFERNTTSCAICHTSQGFTERLANGGTSTAAPIDDPVPINCRTCHNIHKNYDLTDYDLVTTSAVTFFTGGTIDIGKGNLCANCHQTRIPDPLPTPGGADVTLTSPYWGVHHGPQASMIAGDGGYEVSGSMSYTNSAHSANSTIKDEGCIVCHMADAYGTQAGGHTLRMSYDYHGHTKDNVAGCLDCHPDLTDFDKDGKQTEIQTLIDSLGTVLASKGVLSNGRLVTGTWSADLAGAYLNYKMVEEDRSLGVHNFKYAKALLVNSIEAIK